MSEENGYGHSHEEEEDITTEELVEDNHVLVNALIDMLIEKNVFSEEEFKAKVKSVEDDIYEADEASDD